MDLNISILSRYKAFNLLYITTSIQIFAHPHWAVIWYYDIWYFLFHYTEDSWILQAFNF